jgi:periplasmic divalent cation tolerance protein
MEATVEHELVDVTVTGPDLDMMADLVRELVEVGLVACGNLLPGVRSIYTWQGNIEAGDEVLAILHTNRENIDQVIAHIARKHPDETPQILALPVVASHSGYRDWLVGATTQSG